MSKLRSGPAVVFCSQHTDGFVQPGAQICGAPGRGNAVKSAAASGIGLELFGFELAVKPVNPVSSPEILPLVPNELSGSVRGPKVRCEMALIGLIPCSYWLKSASA